MHAGRENSLLKLSMRKLREMRPEVMMMLSYSTTGHIEMKQAVPYLS